jgi:predicted NBD/HSP70 family sugar kinase
VTSAIESWMNTPVAGAVGSTTLVRELNERSLLDLLRRNGPTSRVELARLTGLSKPTVSTALANLVRSRLAIEDGAESGKRGPAAILYRADPNAGFVMSVDVGRNWIRALVADLSGTSIARTDIANRARSASALLQAIAGLTETVSDKAHELAVRRKLSISTTVIGGPGVLDDATGTMRVAGGLPGWSKAGFAHELRALINGHVVFENDINLAALGEHASGAAQGSQDFVLLSIGNGIGCGIVLGNQLFKGANGSAGEAGFLPLDLYSRSTPSMRRVDPSIGVLEQAVCGDAITARANELGLRDVEHASQVFELAASGNKRAQRVREEVGELLGRAITVITSLFDPEKIVINGGVGSNLEVLRPHINEALQRLSPFSPTIVSGSLGDAAALYGGVCIGLPFAREQLFANR